MKTHRIIAIVALALLLIAGLMTTGMAADTQGEEQQRFVVTDTLRVMGKGVDHIVVGEEPLYVVPEVTKITSHYGTTIDLNRLLTPCLAEVTYALRMEGVEKRKWPVVLELKVKRVSRRATTAFTQER